MIEARTPFIRRTNWSAHRRVGWRFFRDVPIDPADAETRTWLRAAQFAYGGANVALGVPWDAEQQQPVTEPVVDEGVMGVYVWDNVERGEL